MGVYVSGLMVYIGRLLKASKGERGISLPPGCPAQRPNRQGHAALFTGPSLNSHAFREDLSYSSQTREAICQDADLVRNAIRRGARVLGSLQHPSGVFHTLR